MNDNEGDRSLEKTIENDSCLLSPESFELLVSILAEKLNLTSLELENQRLEGKSVHQIALEQGVFGLELEGLFTEAYDQVSNAAGGRTSSSYE